MLRLMHHIIKHPHPHSLLAFFMLLLVSSKALAACPVGEKQTNVSIPIVTVTAPRRTVRWKKFWASGLYSAPPGYAITDFDYRITSKYQPSHWSWKWVSGGTRYASREQISTLYKNAMDVAARYKNFNLEAQLNEERRNFIELSSQVDSNRSAIEMKLSRKAAGLFRGSRTVSIQPVVSLLCVGTPEQMQDRVDDALRELPRN